MLKTLSTVGCEHVEPGEGNMDGTGSFEYHFTRHGALWDPRERMYGEPTAMMPLVTAQ
jgi:hypothetical protein